MFAREIHSGARRLRFLDALPPHGTTPRGTLVLVHAFPLNARLFEPQAPLARLGWRVVAPQLRGFDGDANEPAAVSMDDYARDVVDLLTALGVGPAVIGGVSMGGYVTFALLRRLPPHLVRGLVLADTRPQADGPEAIEARKAMLRTLAEGGVEAVADAMIPKLVGETTRRIRPEIADLARALALTNSVDAVAGAIAALMTRPDSTPLLSSIHCPTLVIVGEEDRVTPPEASRGMHQAIEGSELVVLPGAGHLANMEAPAAFNDALGRFLDRV